MTCLVARLYARRHRWPAADAVFAANCDGVVARAVWLHGHVCEAHRQQRIRLGSLAFAELYEIDFTATSTVA